MTTERKIWALEAINLYPKQWVVLTEVECDTETGKHMGIVYLVTPEKDEAYRVSMELRGSGVKTIVIEGFNDKPHIGGLHSVGY